MERPLSLENLPVVIIDHVASYLSIEDIASCCAASSKMRDVFSDDLIWKRHCNIKCINYLKRSVSWVEPSFQWEDDTWSNLSPITDWKRNYMMQTHLLKNWRKGRFGKSEIEFGPANVVYSRANMEFYENDYLFLHTCLIKENKLLDEIWDVVERVPFLHSSFNLNFDQFDELDWLDLFKIVDNKLIVGLHNLVLIYDIALGSFTRIPLRHAFLFDKSEKCSKDVITHDEETFYKTTFFELALSVEVIISGFYFVGVVTNFKDCPSPTFHVWNIQTGKKVEEVSVPAVSLTVESLQFLSCEDKKNIVVKLRVLKDRYTYHCYGYDLSTMKFTSFFVQINYCDFALFKNKLVIGAAAERLYVYSYETSKKLLVQKCAQQILKKTMNIVGHLLLFGTFENIVHVVDLSTMKTINKVKLGLTLYSLRVICDRFVVINTVNSEVWEIGKSAKKLFKFPVNGSFVAVNQHCTKLAIEKENKIIILHFW